MKTIKNLSFQDVPEVPRHEIHTRSSFSRPVLLPPVALHADGPGALKFNFASEQHVEKTHSLIQSTWSLFSNLNDTDRNSLLKGLLSRSSTKQVQLICTYLNLKTIDTGMNGVCTN